MESYKSEEEMKREMRNTNYNTINLLNGGSESIEDLIADGIGIFSKNYQENDTELNKNNNRDERNSSLNKNSNSFTSGQIEDLLIQLTTKNTTGACYFVMFV